MTIPRTYQRAGKPALLDPLRLILTPFTPEEQVRQDFIRHLLQDVGIPQEMLESEVSMAHFERGVRDRADIVGYYRDEQGDVCALFVVEVKARSVALTDDTFDQAARYADALGIDLLCLTNGDQEDWYVEGEEDWSPFTPPKSYGELLERSRLDMIPEPPPVERIGWRSWTDAQLAELTDYGIIGQGSPREHFDFLVSLGGLFHSTDSTTPSIDIPGRQCAGGGVRMTSFGNAGGGNFPGEYRVFVVTEADGESLTASVSILSQAKKVNDPKWGNRAGHTYAMFALDDFEKSHMSLELDLDRFVRHHSDHCEIWHDGSLTHGRRGAVKRRDVIDFVQSHSPRLVRGNEVHLGSLPNTRQIEWEDVREFLSKGIEYALLRDQFRQQRE